MALTTSQVLQKKKKLGVKKNKKKNYRPMALPQKYLQKNLYLDPSLSNFLDLSLD
jgi:hypothetical protein